MAKKLKEMSDAGHPHKKKLPVHPSDADDQVPTEFHHAEGYEEDEEMDEEASSLHKKHLPTHHKASSEVPDKDGMSPEGQKDSTLDDTKMGHELPEEADEEDKEEMSEEEKYYDEKEVEEAVDAALAKKDEEDLDEESEEDSEEDEKDEVDEAVGALMKGENLSETFKVKASAIFESAVARKVEQKRKNIREAYKEVFSTTINEAMDTLVERVSDYMDYMVQEWMEENQIAIETSLKTEITESFMEGLRQLFVEKYIEVPEDKTDIFKQLEEENGKLKKDLNNQIQKNVSLNKKLNESVRDDLVEEACKGLTEMQADKLKVLTENVSFENRETFKAKVNSIRESYFAVSNEKSQEALFESGIEPTVTTSHKEEDEIDPIAASYLR